MFPEEYILFAVISILVLLWIRWRKRKMQLFQRYGIPGPKPNFIFGNIIEFHKKREKCIVEWIEKYGNIYGFFLGGNPWIICSDIELLKIIQIKEFNIFANRSSLIPDAGISHKEICKSLPFRKDKDWKLLRSILSKSFSSARMKIISSLLPEAIKIFLEKIKKEKEKPFEISEFYKKLTFDIICRSGLGFKTNVQNEETNKFVQSVYQIFEVNTSDILVGISILFPEFEPIPTYLRRIVDFLKNTLNYPCVRVIFETCRKIIVFRKQSDYHAPDLLQTMIDAEDESDDAKKKLSPDSLIANAILLMAAAYDTTSCTLAWCTEYLSQHPAIQEQVRQELIEHVGNNRDIEYTDLPKFEYLDRVISETLRLHPLSTIAINRICSEDFSYKDIIIPKGVSIGIPIKYLQNDYNYWEEPKKFNPDRFSNYKERKIDSIRYQPFGSGPRSCIGARMAQAIMKLTLANLLRSFRLESYGNMTMDESEKSLFIIRPKNGIFIKAFPIISR